ncbi:inosine guanosine and xanthosine phosphorylase family protein [Thelephora ganbajun]|uniref:Inosine guanosine and xanthosine phosphorylase family protein n=1 Tax=Thelephora ganbajun TaxID=370292 RepID=A0ACB6ZVL1_THEGA|nr:inosine guanosine and xanthosine phosphorylase family protein [Thelephora ganbajun]
MTDAQLPFAAALESLAKCVPQNLIRPKVGIICGSGLSTLAASLTDTVYVPYGEIPGFLISTVDGHKNSLVFGLCGDVPVVAMLGRFHAYEGYPFQKIMFPVRVMARLGVKNLIVTNASGSLNPNIPVGTIVVLHDHLGIPNLSGFNPLLGPQHDKKIPRFLPTSNAYSTSLRRLFFHAVHELGFNLDDFAEGTYAWVSGPTYESPAEGRFIRAAGADVVGMSTVPEVLAAKEEGLEVIALSLVTNFVIIPDTYRSIKAEVKAQLEGKIVEDPLQPVVSHQEVLEIGLKKAEIMRAIVERVVQKIP